MKRYRIVKSDEDYAIIVTSYKLAAKNAEKGIYLGKDITVIAEDFAEAIDILSGQIDNDANTVPKTRTCFLKQADSGYDDEFMDARGIDENAFS